MKKKMIGKPPVPPGFLTAFAADPSQIIFAGDNNKKPMLQASQIEVQVVRQAGLDLQVSWANQQIRLKLPTELQVINSLVLDLENFKVTDRSNQGSARNESLSGKSDVDVEMRLMQPVAGAAVRILQIDDAMLQTPIMAKIFPSDKAAFDIQSKPIISPAVVKLRTMPLAGSLRIDVTISPSTQHFSDERLENVNPRTISQNDSQTRSITSNTNKLTEIDLNKSIDSPSVQNQFRKASTIPIAPLTNFSSTILQYSPESVGRDSEIKTNLNDENISPKKQEYQSNKKNKSTSYIRNQLNMTVSNNNQANRVTLIQGDLQIEPELPLPGLGVGQIVEVNLNRISRPRNAIDEVFGRLLGLERSIIPNDQAAEKLNLKRRRDQVVSSLLKSVVVRRHGGSSEGVGIERASRQLASSNIVIPNTSSMKLAAEPFVGNLVSSLLQSMPVSDDQIVSLRGNDTMSLSFCSSPSPIEWSSEDDDGPSGDFSENEKNGCRLELQLSELGKVTIILDASGSRLHAILNCEGVLDNCIQTEIADLFGAGAELSNRNGQLIMRFARPASQSV